jgi:hypothetical protein
MTLLGRDVLACLSRHPALLEHLTWQQINRFLNFARKIWPEIIGSSKSLPLNLPQHAAGFLSSVLGLELSLIELCWIAFRELVSKIEETQDSVVEDDLFRIHGRQHQIGELAFVKNSRRFCC